MSAEMLRGPERNGVKRGLEDFIRTTKLVPHRQKAHRPQLSLLRSINFPFCPKYVRSNLIVKKKPQRELSFQPDNFQISSTTFPLPYPSKGINVPRRDLERLSEKNSSRYRRKRHGNKLENFIRTTKLVSRRQKCIDRNYPYFDR